MRTILISHSEAKTIHELIQGNLSGPCHDQSLESLHYRNRIAEIFGSGKDGSIDGDALCDFHDRVTA